MLKSITIENFKSFGKKQSLPLAPLTLMIGANASGKSNAIEAFRFLSFLAEGQNWSVLQHDIDDSNCIFRGSHRDLGHDGSEEFTLGCETDDKYWDMFSVEIIIEQDSQICISKEKLYSSRCPTPLCYSSFENKGNDHRYGSLFILNLDKSLPDSWNDDILRSLIKKQAESKPNQTDQSGFYCDGKVFKQMSMLSLSYIQDASTMSLVEAKTNNCNTPSILVRDFKSLLLLNISKLLYRSLFIDPIPSTMRGDSFPEKKLNNNCSNLAGVLQVLCENPDKKSLLLQFIKSLPEQNFTDIKFSDDRRGRYFFELIETFGGAERSCLSELLSDGTLRVLAVAAALLSAPEGSTVVIEEIDNGIHPSRAHDLMALMLERAKARKIRLLLTTHNPALMDALPDEALGDVVFSYRDPKDGDSRLVRLSDLDDYAGLVLQGPLGDLVTRGVVDRFVKNPVSPEEKKAKASAWLERMKELRD